MVASDTPRLSSDGLGVQATLKLALKDAMLNGADARKQMISK